MKVKLTKFERAAGLFVGVAIMSSIVLTVLTAIKKGWFSLKSEFTTTFDTASGIHAGTLVQMAGLRVGSVDNVDLLDDNKVLVKFSILEKFVYRIRQDSVVIVTRPFIIGEKVLDVSVGNPKLPGLKGGSAIRSEEAMDIMDLFSGRKIGPYLEMMARLFENLRVIAQAFLDPERSKIIVKAFDELYPLMVNINKMSHSMIDMSEQLTEEKRLQTVMKNFIVVTRELNSMLPHFRKVSPKLAKDTVGMISNLNQITGDFGGPQFVSDFQAMVKNFSLLSEEFKMVVPALAAVSDDLPQAGVRAIEALDEAVVLLKAMQRSFLLKSSVEEVREEEAKNKKARVLDPVKVNRVPTNDPGEEKSDDQEN